MLWQIWDISYFMYENPHVLSMHMWVFLPWLPLYSASQTLYLIPIYSFSASIEVAVTLFWWNLMFPVSKNHKGWNRSPSEHCTRLYRLCSLPKCPAAVLTWPRFSLWTTAEIEKCYPRETKLSIMKTPVLCFHDACGERGGLHLWRWMSQCIDSNWHRNAGALWSSSIHPPCASLLPPRSSHTHSSGMWMNLPANPHFPAQRNSLLPLSLCRPRQTGCSHQWCVCSWEGFLEPCLDICDSSVCLVVAFVLNGASGEGPVKCWWRTAVALCV